MSQRPGGPAKSIGWLHSWYDGAYYAHDASVIADGDKWYVYPLKWTTGDLRIGAWETAAAAKDWWDQNSRTVIGGPDNDAETGGVDRDG